MEKYTMVLWLTVYLGKMKSADWVTLIDKDLLTLTDRVDLETMLIDTDQDGLLIT
jgi:OOP family OmpA-OmpF porin